MGSKMQLGIWLVKFAHDDKVKLLLLLIALDFVLGVIASVRLKTFRLSYLADFLRNDILFKLFPYFALYAAALVAGGVDLVLPNLDFGFVAGAAWVVFTGALAGSILSSLRTLKVLPSSIPNEIAGAENVSPPKS